MIQYENKYNQNDEMISEYVKKVLCKKTQRIGGLFSVFAFVMLIFTIWQKDNIMAAVFGTCLIIILLTLAILSPSMKKGLKEANNRLHGGKQYETVVQFGDKITLSEGNVFIEVDYTQVQEIYDLKYSCVLKIGKNNSILLSPSGFTVGTYEDFQTFIREKCGPIKVYEK
ncbi:MAG: YcxB family protein [Lachnospiraceae bacterium]|nr:YcxB family protein [Lachnospiraceae bacterium]